MFSSKRSFSKLKILLAIAFGTTLGVIGFSDGEAQATTSSLSVSVVSGENPSVSLPQTAEGRFVSSSATTFQVSTTHAAGYTLTASASELTDGTNTIATLDSGISADDFSGNTNYNNKWGFKPSVSYNETTGTTAANTNYLPAPITKTQTLAKTSDKTGGTYDISFGVRANNSTAEGTYTSTITIAVTGNPTPYTITYDANTTDTVSGMPSNVSTSSANETVTLSSNSPTRDGYTFKGWCSVATSDENCSGTSYSAGGSLALDQTVSSNSLTLYAMWKKDDSTMSCEKLLGIDECYMQNFRDESFKEEVSNAMDDQGQETITIKDNRDDKTYYVAKLADGNIWMTQNLDFDIVSGTTYTSKDTDVKADWTPSTGTYVTDDTTWAWSTSTPESYDPGDLCWNGTIDTSWSGTLDTMTTSCSESGANERWQIGNYYNWTAAVAMNDSSSYGTDGTDVDQSICPAGWRLPTYSGNYSYQKLLRESGYSVSSGTSGNIQSDPFYFVYGGYWDGWSSDVGSSGYYWSSVVSDSDNAYVLSFGANGNLLPQSGDNRDYGNSVRCVAR